MRARRFAVIGDPIAHSLSPVMHGAAFAAMSLPHTYEAMRVSANELPPLLDRLRRGEFHGFNVTVPHKVEALSMCDVPTAEAASAGAVNTLFVDATGRLVGTNTDVDGLRSDLTREGIAPKSALVLGAGGAARAAVVALSTLGASVFVAARNDDRARALVTVVGRSEAIAWASLRAGAPFDLVINATNAGMAGSEDGAPIAEAWTRASKANGAVAYDLIYRPAVTPFLARAASEGHRALCGLGMLVEQGARALSVFLGVPIGVEVRAEMRRAVVEALG